MAGRHFVEFSDSFSGDGRGDTPKDRWPPHGARPLNFGTISRQHLALCVRSGLCALAFPLGGSLLFILTGCYVIVFLAGSHCGPTFAYYGCELLTKTEMLRSPAVLRPLADTSSDRPRAMQPYNIANY
jgi:hypothetical protein